GLEDDDDIERDRHVLDVEQVVLQLLDRVFDAGAIRIADLRPARQPGLQYVPLTIVGDLLDKLLHELGPFRPGTHEAHVTAEDVHRTATATRNITGAPSSRPPAEKRMSRMRFAVISSRVFRKPSEKISHDGRRFSTAIFPVYSS